LRSRNFFGTVRNQMSFWFSIVARKAYDAPVFCVHFT
jgi:hypothetical protein